MNRMAITPRALSALVALAVTVTVQIPMAVGAERTQPVVPGEVAARAPVSLSAEPDLAATLEEMSAAVGAPGPMTPPPDVSALAADDEIPGVPVESVSELPYPFVRDHLDLATDRADVFSVVAYPGEQIWFHVDPDPAHEGGSTLDVLSVIWGPSATSVLDLPIQYGSRVGPGLVEWICYTVPESAPAPTTYYVGALAVAGSNEVEYAWGVTSRSDGNIPGVTLPDTGHLDRVTTERDADDVFAVHAGEGETLNVDVTVGAGDGPISLLLYGPGTQDVWGVAPLVADMNKTALHVEYLVGPGGSGVYYVRVFTATSNSDYTLGWTADGPNLPGRPVPPSPATADMADGISVAYIDLRPGETFELAMADPGDHLDLWLLPPDTVNVATGTSVSADIGSAAIKTLEYLVPEGQGGRYYIIIEADAAVDTTAEWEIIPSAVRLSGEVRYDTAARVSERDFCDGAHTVVIASGEGFADALSAAGLAGAYDAPILLVPRSSLPLVVRDEIMRLGASRCYIVGGTAVIDEAVRSAIDAIPGMSAPVRIGGADRYETSALVADAVFTKDSAVDWPLFGAIARGDLFADALALAPMAWAAKIPILLTRTEALPAPIDDRLASDDLKLPFTVIAFAGGTSAISEDVFNYVNDDVADGGLGISSGRLEGVNRYETAAAIADWGSGSPYLSYEAVGVATGEAFPDALGGGAAIGKIGGVLLLTEPTRLTDITLAQLTAYVGETREVQVFGGSMAIADPVFAAIESLY